MSIDKIGNSFLDNRQGTRIIEGMVPTVYDIIIITYPTPKTEIYKFYLSNDKGADKLHGTIKFTYTKADKCRISRIERV